MIRLAGARTGVEVPPTHADRLVVASFLTATTRPGHAQDTFSTLERLVAARGLKMPQLLVRQLDEDVKDALQT